MTGRTFFLIICLIFLRADPSFAIEQWFEAYDLAMNDIKVKNWLVAETRLKSALKQHPQQGRKVRAYGARFMRYFPEYYLGVVYFQTGRYQNALENFLSLQNKEIIGEDDAEYKEMMQYTQNAMAKLNPQIKPAPGEKVIQPDASADIAAQTEKHLPESKVGAKELQDAAPPAETAAKLEPPVKSPELPAVPLRKEPAEISNSKEPELRFVLNEIRAAQKAKDWKNLERSALKLELLDPSNPELPRLNMRLELRKAMIAFYSGNYEESLKLLKSLTSTIESSGEAHFYLGCSLAALGFYERENRNAFLEQARKEFSIARKLEPKLSYAREYISPRILRLYEKTN